MPFALSLASSQVSLALSLACPYVSWALPSTCLPLPLTRFLSTRPLLRRLRLVCPRTRVPKRVSRGPLPGTSGTTATEVDMETDGGRHGDLGVDRYRRRDRRGDPADRAGLGLALASTVASA